MKTVARPLRLIFVVGWERSGSTILGNVLAENSGVTTIGELSHLWRDPSTSVCGCGESLESCPFWNAVTRSLPTKLRSAEGWQRAGDLADRFISLRKTGCALTDRASKALLADAREFSSILRHVYGAVAEVAGAHTIIDLSKAPSMVGVLRLLEGIDVTYVHLVRDPRATAYSSQRRPLVERLRGPFMTASRWLLWNALAEWMRRRSPDRWAKVRYEDFASNPLSTVELVLAGVQVSADRALMEQLAMGCVHLGQNHVIQANPSKFKRGVVSIEPDNEWREGIAKASGILVTLIGGIMLRRYGYPIRWKRSM